MEQQGIDMKLYARYVDDETIVCDAIPEDETNDRQEADERTMKKLQSIANAIHPSIQLTIDYPSNNVNGRIPILDTEQWLEPVEFQGRTKVHVLHSHYSKPMANQSLILRKSAFPYKSKMNVLVADLVRVMRNVSRKCNPGERLQKVQSFMNRMQFSGYTKKERYEVFTKAKKRYDEMLRKSAENVKPLYRSKTWHKEERNIVKRDKKNNWYSKDGSEAVFFVDTTPNEELANLCREVFKSQGVKVKVVEKVSSTVKNSLTKSNPFKELGCRQESCKVCKTGDEVDCKARDVVYKITCKGKDKDGEICKGVDYVGETARSIAERFREHLSVINSHQEVTRKKSFLYEHLREKHDGKVPPLGIQVIRRCFADASLRQAMEATIIRDEDPILNRKEEFNNEPRKRCRKRVKNVTSQSSLTSSG